MSKAHFQCQRWPKLKSRIFPGWDVTPRRAEERVWTNDYQHKLTTLDCGAYAWYIQSCRFQIASDKPRQSPVHPEGCFYPLGGSLSPFGIICFLTITHCPTATTGQVTHVQYFPHISVPSTYCVRLYVHYQQLETISTLFCTPAEVSFVATQSSPTLWDCFRQKDRKIVTQLVPTARLSHYAAEKLIR